MAEQKIVLKSVFLPLLIVLAALVIYGCQDDPTVWKQDIRSPDGAWMATAQTKQWGGFGTAWVETTVSVRKINATVNHGKPFDIFSYPGGGSIPQTYKLSSENADEDLQVLWLTPTHLQVTHKSPVHPDLAVVRFSDLDISFR